MVSVSYLCYASLAFWSILCTHGRSQVFHLMLQGASFASVRFDAMMVRVLAAEKRDGTAAVDCIRGGPGRREVYLVRGTWKSANRVAG